MAAMICVLFWGNARFEEAAAITMQNVSMRGYTMRIVIKKGKCNQGKRPQVMVIHPNSKEAKGNICPFKVLSRYLEKRQSFSGTKPSDTLYI